MKKPMLACSVTEQEIHHLKYPLYLSIKLDGIRVMKVDGRVMTRTGKRIPNVFVERQLIECPFNNVEGELYIPGASFNETQSVVMSEQGQFDAINWDLFDVLNMDSKPFKERLACMPYIPYVNAKLIAKSIPQTLINSDKEAFNIIQWCKDSEGVIFRDPEQPYKAGRSTLKEQGTLKFVFLKEGRARCAGVKSLFRDGEWIPTELGALICETEDGKTFSIGTGFTAEQRKDFAKFPPIGKTITYHYKDFGAKNCPRQPSFYGIDA